MKSRKRFRKIFALTVVCLLILSLSLVFFGAAAPNDTASENNTFLGNVQKWLEEYSSQVVSALSGVVLFIYAVVNSVRQKKKMLSLTNSTAEIVGTTNSTNTAQGQVVSRMNDVIVAFNALEQKFNDNLQLEQGRYNTLAESVTLLKTILEILMSVYPNSKNLPQGVKDLITLQYADALKALKSIAENGVLAGYIETSEDAVGVTEAVSGSTTAVEG